MCNFRACALCLLLSNCTALTELSGMFYFFKCLFILRERACTLGGGVGGGRERGKERESESQAGSMLSAQNPAQGLISHTIRSLPEPKSRVRHLSNWATQEPLECFNRALWEGPEGLKCPAVTSSSHKVNPDLLQHSFLTEGSQSCPPLDQKRWIALV